MYTTSNPMANSRMFAKARAGAQDAGTMTIDGTSNKLSFLLVLVVLGAGIVWQKAMAGDTAFASSAMIIGLIGGLIFALITIFKMNTAHITAPIYAVFEGLTIGGMSAYAEMQYKGIAMQAVALTFGTLFALIFAYKSGVIKVTQKFKAGVFAATAGICFFYLMTMLLGFFGINFGGSMLAGNGAVSIGLSVFIVVIAALNLVIDFDFIVKASESGAPKKMEWYGAFALLVTLIWLYIEILRLLMKLRSRD